MEENDGINLVPPEDPSDYAIWAAALGVALYMISQFTEPEPEPEPTPQKCTLTVESRGPGYVTVIINGKGKGTVDHETKKFKGINYGASVLCDVDPDKKAVLRSINKKSFTITKDSTVTATFEQKAGPKAENPYGLPDKKWGVIRPRVQNMMKKKKCSAFFYPGAPVVFGFKGWFNDRQLVFPEDMDCSEYLRKIANLVSMGAPDPLIDVHKTIWGGFAKDVNYSQLVTYTKEQKK